MVEKRTQNNGSRLNILWVIDHVCYDGNLHGGGRLYWNVVPRFDQNRFHVIPCFLRSSDEVRKVFENSPAPVTIFDKGKYDLTTLWTLLRVIRRERIHVMHLHCYASSTFGRLAGGITGVPTIVHDYDTNIYFPYMWYLRLADRVLAGMTKGAIAASPMVRNFLMNRRRIDGKKIRMMFHAIPSKKYAPVEEELVIRTKQKLGVPRNALVVGTVTKLGPERGNEYLLEAAKEVLHRQPDVHFVLVYKPTYYHRVPDAYRSLATIHDTASMRADLEKLARDLGIEKNCHFIDSLDDPDEFVSMSDLIVAPFLNARFSCVYLLEAMALGKPLIATDMGEQREIIKDGINGRLVPPGDVKQMAGAIVGLLANPSQLRNMGLEARKTSEGYTIDRYVGMLQDWYTELAEAKAPSASPSHSLT